MNPATTLPGGSRFPAPTETGNGNAALVRVWELAEPEPRTWIVPGLVPSDATTILYGDGGTAKSYLCIRLAILALNGGGFLGAPVTRLTAVLYVDAELDDEEFRRRAYAVARGLGLERPPKGLYYRRIHKSLLDVETQALLRTDVEQLQTPLVIVDSITVGAAGSDVKEVDVATKLMWFLGELGTVIAVDHIAKLPPGTSQSDVRPFGSVFKYNLGRSVLQVIKADGGGLLIRHTKSNFGPLMPQVGVAVEFGDRKVTFTSIVNGDPRLAGVETHLPALDRVAHVLAERGSATPDDLAAHLGMETKTVRNHLTTLRKQGRAQGLGDGRWAVPDFQSPEQPESGTPEVAHA